MRAYRAAAFTLAAFTLPVLPAAAQDTRSVEVTPYVAVGTAGASPFGTAVTFTVTSKLSIEADVAYRREAPFNALSTNASLLYSLPRVGRATPYVAAGVGLWQYVPPVFSGGASPPGAQLSVAPTVNVGGGLKVPMNDTMDWRTDARWFKSFGQQGSEQFRVAQGIAFDVKR